MNQYENFQKIIVEYVNDYNKELEKKLLADEDFFGDSIRLIDFLNKYYKMAFSKNDSARLLSIKKNLDIIKSCFTGINKKNDNIYDPNISLDIYRQSKKGVHKVRRIIPSISDKQKIFDSLIDSYDVYNKNYKNQEYLVYTNNSIYDFELKDDYFPHIIGLSLKDNMEDHHNLADKEIEYYKNLPKMINQLKSPKALKSLDNYEHNNLHSLFNYSYLNVKNSCFQNFYFDNLPMLVYNNKKKENSNVKMNTYFLKPIKINQQIAFSSIGFHENSKFNFGYAESNIEFIDKIKLNGECGVTTALFKKDKNISVRDFKLVKIFTINEQIKYIDFLLHQLNNKKIVNEFFKYQMRLKKSLFEYVNFECRIINEFAK